jgi:hypothetical protein
MPGKHCDSTLKQATTASFHTLTNASFTNFPIQHYIENKNIKPTERVQMMTGCGRP